MDAQFRVFVSIHAFREGEKTSLTLHPRLGSLTSMTSFVKDSQISFFELKKAGLLLQEKAGQWPRWRNWLTRRTSNVVAFGLCRFESGSGHYEYTRSITDEFWLSGDFQAAVVTCSCHWRRYFSLVRMAFAVTLRLIASKKGDSPCNAHPSCRFVFQEHWRVLRVRS